MNRTLLALWVIIFGSIVAVVALLVVSMQQREAQAKLDLAGLLRAQLTVYNRDLKQLFEQYDRQLQQALEGFDPELSDSVLTLQRQPLCGLVVVVGDDGFKGKLWYPDPQRVDMTDRSLVEDALTWIRDNNFTHRSAANSSQALQNANAQSAVPQAALPQTAAPQQQTQSYSPITNSPYSSQRAQSRGQRDQAASAAPLASQRVSNSFPREESHWTTWYHGRGLVLGYWAQSLHQTVTMIIVPRGRWLADVVAAMPDNTEGSSDSLVQLIDIEGTTIAQWGNVDLISRTEFDSELAVEDPLEGWRLRLTLTPAARAAALGLGNRWFIGLGATGLSLALVLLGVLITVNINRQLRLAQQQVSFVNQVSHELRTPLTNIRMYADLALHGLEAHRDSGIENELDRLEVIQHETTRLGTLIENVLTFARSGKPRPLRTTQVDSIDHVIDGVLATFEPQLHECNMTVERSIGDIYPVHIDREAFEQIMVNLISNAIKYASAGGQLKIETAYSREHLKVLVVDHGPGIPSRLRRRIFDPFVRGSNRLEDPAGTGIGLSIARQLARQHGGDCRLLPTVRGCTFEVVIKVT